MEDGFKGFPQPVLAVQTLHDRFPVRAPYINMQVGGGVGVLSLNTAFTFGSAGVCRGYRWCSPVTDYLTDFYLLVIGKTGSPGALTLQVRDVSASSALLPGTLLTSDTFTPTTTAIWYRVSFTTPQLLTQGKHYFIVVGDAAGSAGNFWQILTSGVTNSESRESNWLHVASTGGFASAGTAGNMAHGGIRYASGLVIGNAVSGSGTPGGTTPRGIKILGLETDVVIFGAIIATTTSVVKFQLFKGDAGPNSTPEFEVTWDATAILVGSTMFPPYRLKAGQVYRAVVTVSGASSAPGQWNCNSMAIPLQYPEMAAMLPEMGRIMGTIGTANNGWTDTYDTIYRLSLLVREVPGSGR